MASVRSAAQVARHPMNDAIGHWVAGFTAGEGCFSLFAGPSGRRAFTVTAAFVIKVRSDDVGALLLVRDTLGCGRVESSKVYRGSHEQTTFAVTRVEDLALRVAPFFEHYPLRGRKTADFNIWAEAVRSIWSIQQRPRTPPGRSGRRWTTDDELAVARYAAEIRAARSWGVR